MSKNPLEEAQKIVREIARELGYAESQMEELDRRILEGEPLYQIVQLPEKLIEERYAMALQMYKSGQLERPTEAL